LFPFNTKELYGISTSQYVPDDYTYLILYNEFDRVSDFAFDGHLETGDYAELVSHILPASIDKIAPDPTEDEDKLLITTFGQSAFANCNGLRAVEIPSTVDTIKTKCFSNSENISSVVIKQIQFIQPLAFEGLGNL
jgi:hypothetical protein